MAKPSPAAAALSPTITLSAALDDARRHDRSPFRRRPASALLPSSGPRQVVARSSVGSLLDKIHRLGASFLLRGGARDGHKAPPPPRSPPPPPAAAPKPPAVRSPERRPLRESGAAAAGAGAEAKGKGEGAMPRLAAGDLARGNGGVGSMRALEKQVSWMAHWPEETVVEEYLWASKYQPMVLEEFICNKDVARELYQVLSSQECSHFIFEGPQGVGKRTMVLALLRDAFGPDKLKITEHTKKFELKGEIANHIDVRVKMSDHHVEINLPELHGYEKHVITTLLDESLQPPNRVQPPNTNCDRSNCTAIVLHGADKLSPDVQHYISWFLEKYAGCNKIFFCCSDASRLEAVKHLCKAVKLQLPSLDEIVDVLEYIAKQENIDLPNHLARRIAESSCHNLQQAIRSFEATWKSNYPFTENQDILTGWEEEISNIAKKIREEQSPRQLYIIRGKIMKLMQYNLPPAFIFCLLISELRKDRDPGLQKIIDDLLSKYNCSHGQHPDPSAQDKNLCNQDMRIEDFAKEASPKLDLTSFMKIEEFMVRFMSRYKSLTAENSGKGTVREMHHRFGR